MEDKKYLDKLHRFERAHFYPIKVIHPLLRSNFVATFSKGEPTKFWNFKEGFISRVLNEGTADYDETMCTYSGDKELAIARVNGEIEFFELDYTEFSKNLEIYSEKKKLKAFDFSPA